MSRAGPKWLDQLPAAARERAARRPFPDWVAPMLATLTDRREFARGWIFEPKLDGVRCLAYGRSGAVRLMSRNKKELNGAYPELVEALGNQLRGDTVVDGEIVALSRGVSRFQRLQQRMGLRGEEAEETGVKVQFHLFDVPYFDGYDLRAIPLTERKRLLQEAIAGAPPIYLVPHRSRDGIRFYHDACRKGWEGLIAKESGSRYVAGRSERWLKLKCVNDQEMVIGGYTDPQGSRVGFGALLVGYYDGEALRYAGKVGTGFDRKTLLELEGRLVKLKTSRSPFTDYAADRSGIHWVRPRLVAQVGFAEWTDQGRLRQPRYLGLREDKSPRDVIRERPEPA